MIYNTGSLNIYAVTFLRQFALLGYVGCSVFFVSYNVAAQIAETMGWGSSSLIHLGLFNICMDPHPLSLLC